jgi:hypothetical protein
VGALFVGLEQRLDGLMKTGSAPFARIAVAMRARRAPKESSTMGGVASFPP